MDIKLERAIEIMETEEEDTFVGTEEEWKAAVKLSAEAMKREGECRENAPREEWLLLPGEAKD